MQFDWPNIDTVLLDMDGTLLDLHFDHYFWVTQLPKIYAEQNQLDHGSAVEYLTPIFMSLRGTLDWYSVDFWQNKLNIDVMHHKSMLANKIAYRPGAKDFLTACNANTQDVRLVTNGHRKVLDLKIKHTSIEQYFDQMICSHELNAAKEQQDFWHRLQTMDSFNPDTTLFVDDSEAVLDAACDYGIKHIYSIAQPDSITPRATASKYPMIERFS